MAEKSSGKTTKLITSLLKRNISSFNEVLDENPVQVRGRFLVLFWFLVQPKKYQKRAFHVQQPKRYVFGKVLNQKGHKKDPRNY